MDISRVVSGEENGRENFDIWLGGTVWPVKLDTA